MVTSGCGRVRRRRADADWGVPAGDAAGKEEGLMDLLLGMLTGQLQASAGTPGALSDFWYQPTGTMTGAGMRIDKDGAQKLSAWFRGREILATTLAMLPFHIYQELPGDEGSNV